MDEFEKRMQFSSFVTTLADVVSKMNPISLVGEGKADIEAAGLKDQYQAAIKRWLDMLMDYTDKARKMGTQYPLEEVLGIKPEGK